MTLSEVASKIAKAKPGQYLGMPKYIGLCPAHEDASPSFAVWEGTDGWLHVKCQAGCTEDAILAALGMSQSDRRLKAPLYTNGKPVPIDYEYTWLDGSYLFTKRRHYKDGKKGFFQLVKEGCKETFSLSGLGVKAKVLYRLPEVLAQATSGGAVYIVEGEKAVESLRKAGHVATCQPAGAGPGKWLGSHTSWLIGASIVIVADRDPEGEEYARQVRAAIGRGRVVQSATTGDHDDAWDHLSAGFTVESLVNRPDLERPARETRAPRKTLADFEPETPSFLFPDWQYLRLGNNNLLDAKGGSGKTTLIMAVAAMASRGVTPAGGTCEPFTTVYYGSEDSGGELRTVFDRFGGDPARLVYIDDSLVFDNEGFDTLADDLDDTGARLFVLDAAKYYLPGGKGSEFDGPGVARFLAGTREAARNHGAAAWLVRHFTRHTKDRDLLDQGAGLSQWYDSCRSVLVALKHPEKQGNSVVWQTKGSILAQASAPFACGYSGGEFGFWEPTDSDFALFGMDEAGRKPERGAGGRRPEQSEACEQFLHDFLRDGPKTYAEICTEATLRGIGKSTVYRTADAMCVIRTRGVWKIHDPYDD